MIDPRTRHVLLRLISVFIYRSGEDDTKVRFWSQILGCEQGIIHNLMKMTRTLDGRPGGSRNIDPTLQNLWPEICHLSKDELKRVFDEIRKGE